MFKEYYIKLEEATKSGFDAGDAMEGISAIALALYIGYGQILPAALDSIRKQVSISLNEQWSTILEIPVEKNHFLNHITEIRPTDKINVGIFIKLSPDRVKGAFGPDYQPIKSVDSKVQTLITKFEHSNAVKKIQEYSSNILKKHKLNQVIFYVVADGKGNSVSGDNVKADVTVRIQAKTKEDHPQDIDVPLIFSLKADSSTVASLGIYNSILYIGKMFKLPLVQGLEDIQEFPDANKRSKIDEIFYTHPEQIKNPSNLLFYIKNYNNVVDKINSQLSRLNNAAPEEKKDLQVELMNKSLEAMKLLVTKCNDQVAEQMATKSQDSSFNEKAFSFIQKHIFGSDMADVIDISDKDIKEIRKANFDALKQKLDVEVAIVGDSMKFIGLDKTTQKRQLLYQIDPILKITPSQKSQFYMIKIGDLFYG